MVDLTPPRHIPTLPGGSRPVETTDHARLRANGSSRPFSVTQLRIRNGSSCPFPTLADAAQIAKGEMIAAICRPNAPSSFRERTGR